VNSKNVDRRTFLKVAGAQTGAMAAGAGAIDSILPGAKHPVGAPWIGQDPPHVCVIGAGAFGGWTALNLRKMGAKVTLVDAWGPGNARATSGDETRGIRTSYGDRGDNSELWCRWSREALSRWNAWDQEWGSELRMRLFMRTGDVILRATWDNFLTETRKIWDRIGTPYEALTIDEVNYRWNVFNTSGMGVALYEPEAGVGRARRSCEAVAEVFRLMGGQLVIARANPGSHEKGVLNDLTLRPGKPLVADQFVFALGPWFPTLFPELLGNRMRTPMGSVYYFGTPPGDARFLPPNMPSWNYPGVTGWPSPLYDNRGFRVRTGGGRGTDPDTSERWVDPSLLVRARAFVADKFPDLADAPIVATHACHYEISASRNFIFDKHPDWSNVWIAGGGNAEGFKFGPVVGEYVARRVMGVDDAPDLANLFRIPEDTYDDPNSPANTRRRGMGGSQGEMPD
jgi:glycine/D-amino acid oxidase-like deaminating enzyme